MSNIERKYAYLDEGVFPEEGEYGITYLTLYSSNAGNTYDGWIYDPNHRIPTSLTERTFGYRHPEYTDYAWDDEVVVDLSNAQNRQESSEFEQGRITSFNTNVSSSPIVLQDVDITGMTEEEREREATTVLFSAIPLVKDAYIQAMIEIQAKVNLSSNNTNGMVRVEAFYILNDESDRTMRPNPVHTFAVATANERHTLPFLYWNPALKHEDSNYIGVKLLCTGGTSEIGISDDPEYGDAIITLTSAGLTGDHIDDATPESLWIEGLASVSYGRVLDIDDYMVFCEYSDGSVYVVTRLCTFSPEMGTQVTQPISLTATYMGLTASMTVAPVAPNYIKIYGVDAYTGNEYTLQQNDYAVFGYYDDDLVEEITSQCTFAPAMGTTISGDTTLVASYIDPVSHNVLTDSMDISHCVARSGSWEDGLVYTLYENGHIVITGSVSEYRLVGDDEFEYHSPEYNVDMSDYRNATTSIRKLVMQPRVDIPLGGRYEYCLFPHYHQRVKITRHWIDGSISENDGDIYDYDRYPSYRTYRNLDYFRVNPNVIVTIPSAWMDRDDVNTVEWRATGKPLGLSFRGSVYGNDIDTVTSKTGTISFVGFDQMDTSNLKTMKRCFMGAGDTCDLSFLDDMTFPALVDMQDCFCNCDVTTLVGIDTSNVISLDNAFRGRGAETLHSGLNFDMGNAKYMTNIFSGSSLSEDPFLYLDTSSVEYVDGAFIDCELLSSFELGLLDTPEVKSADFMFLGIKSNSSSTDFISDWIRCPKLKSIVGMFASPFDVTGYNANVFSSYGRVWSDYYANGGINLDGFDSFMNALPLGCNMSYMFAQYKGTSIADLNGAASAGHVIDQMFINCRYLTSLNGSQTIFDNCKSAQAAFMNCISLTDVSAASSWVMGSCEDIRNLFYGDQNDVGNWASAVGGWNTQSLKACSYALYTLRPTQGGGSHGNLPSASLLAGWNASGLLNDQHAQPYTPNYGPGSGNSGAAPAYYQHGTPPVIENIIPWYKNSTDRLNA